ncbi:hypothetical protein KAR91_68955 [Candidatus Pacearchaeota archaeon]|nr:hypothetical protein [Candidatus Pacearchaeota archaeon]
MSVKSHTVILPRREENLIAVVKCDCRADSNDEVMDKIVRAITEWVKKQPSGKEAWMLSANDFNIADLSVELDYPQNRADIAPFLTEEGIYNLEVDVFEDSDSPVNYNYDTVLVKGL